MTIEQIKKIIGPLVLLFVCFIAYLPLSSFLFALKNDAFIYNFPNKYFFSEALRHGYLPTWNPYLNYGFPLYADPGFAWWHPITWLFGIIGYNAYTFTIEVLLYIYIAGLGMYGLGRNLNLHKKTCLIMGCMFMCSGFFIGNLQHINFLTCAAFLPWLISSWLLFQRQQNATNLIRFGISMYLLNTGGHPAIPIGTAYYGVILAILYPLFQGLHYKLKDILIINIRLIIISLLLLSPLIYSYLTLFPYYSRSGVVNHLESANVGFTLTSYLSFILPLSTIKNSDFFLTDVSMRNAYFTLFGFTSFLLFFFNNRKNSLQKVFCIAGLLMLFLSFGGNVKENIYSHLPLLRSVRTNGEFRVFAIFSFIICGSFEFDKIFSNKEFYVKKLKFLFTGLAIFSLLGSIVIILLFNSNLNLTNDSISKIQLVKQVIDNITFKHVLLISLMIASLLSAIYLWAVFQNRWRNMLLLTIFLDICLNSWLLLPITGVGRASVFKMQQIISKSPKGFHSPTFIYSQPFQRINEEETALIGNWSWYDKKIVHSRIVYPSQLSATERFYQTKDTSLIKNKAFAYLKNNHDGIINLCRFTPNSFCLKTLVPRTDTLIILQNYFPGWEAYVNDEKVPIFTYCGTFIAITVNENSKKVNLHFRPFEL